jgi:sigma-E factor negative regulatory protein RseB
VIRLRLLLLVGSLGALLTGTSLACVAPGPEAEALTTPSRSADALKLLERAADIARTRAWSGTQSVVSTRGGLPTFTQVRVRHTPGAGSSVEEMATKGATTAPDLLDESLFDLLVSHYDLTVAGPTLCAGRTAVLVLAHRPGRTGVGAVAGRFWVDDATRMVMRRDVLDDSGSVVLSSLYEDLRFTAPQGLLQAAATAPSGTVLDDAGLVALKERGWPIVDHLPSDMELFEALQHDDGVVQLAYSDGLSTLSLFVQEGSLPDDTEGTLREVGGALVHVTPGTPEQLVWSGGGRTWTLVSDAPDSAIEQAVLVLPHADPVVDHEGVPERVWRGMSRVGAWLNPFD